MCAVRKGLSSGAAASADVRREVAGVVLGVLVDVTGEWRKGLVVAVEEVGYILVFGEDADERYVCRTGGEERGDGDGAVVPRAEAEGFVGDLRAEVVFIPVVGRLVVPVVEKENFEAGCGCGCQELVLEEGFEAFQGEVVEVE